MRKSILPLVKCMEMYLSGTGTQLTLRNPNVVYCVFANPERNLLCVCETRT